MTLPIALLAVGNLAFVAFIAWLFVRRSRERVQAQAALRQRVIERFESSKDLTAFLETDAGRRLLGSFGPDANPAAKVLGSINAGIVLVLIGLGFLYSAGTGNPSAFLPGWVIFASGLGCLAAAWVSHRLSRRWGLNEPVGDGSPRPPATGA